MYRQPTVPTRTIRKKAQIMMSWRMSVILGASGSPRAVYRKLRTAAALEHQGQVLDDGMEVIRDPVLLTITLAIIALLLYINFRRFAEVAIILGTLPMALIGGLWLLYWLGYELSVAVGVGFIALAGVAVEIGVVMLVYLNQAIRRHIGDAESKGRSLTVADVQREDVARLLPGVVRSALSYIEAGDYAAAERALPGQMATVHDGPGHRRRARRAWVAPLTVFLGALGALACVACWLLS